MSPTLTMITSIVGLLLAVSPFALFAYFGYLRDQEKLRLAHEEIKLARAERMAAIEKGIELPPLPHTECNLQPARAGRARAPRRQYGWALSLIFAGAAITLAMWETGERRFWWGLVPPAIGVALLLSSLLEAGSRRGAKGADEDCNDEGGRGPDL
jgi:hypothetical protein